MDEKKMPRRQRRIASHKKCVPETEERDGWWFLRGDARHKNKEIITGDRVCNHIIEQWRASNFGKKRFIENYLEKFTGATGNDVRKLTPYVKAICCHRPPDGIAVSLSSLSATSQRSENDIAHEP